jgi:A/G-specific adenine glycosylase
MQWYANNKRDLPWRRTRDPYHIWVSEIILQQTRVEQGLAYYHRFLERFPDVESLAIAEEEDVMKVWQGLGYYTRARNIHFSAKVIKKEHQSVFPVSYDEIRRLKGIGEYSASAISSIVYGTPHPVIDGNVLRLVSRYAGIIDPVNSTSGKKKIKAFLDIRIDHGQPGIFNQAAMEMGALVCKPKLPLCAECPLRDNCIAFREGTVSQLPVISKPTKISVRNFNYIVIFSGKKEDPQLWIRKRTATDIWKSLYDFPLLETKNEIFQDDLESLEDWNYIAGKHHLKITQSFSLPKYMLSHRELRVKFFITYSIDYIHKDFIKIPLFDFYNYPVPRLIENILKKITTSPGIFSQFPD